MAIYNLQPRPKNLKEHGRPSCKVMRQCMPDARSHLITQLHEVPARGPVRDRRVIVVKYQSIIYVGIVGIVRHYRKDLLIHQRNHTQYFSTRGRTPSHFHFAFEFVFLRLVV